MNWKRYTIEFISVFVAVFLAFALYSWYDSRSSSLSEKKILTEIKNGITLDKRDFQQNIEGHRLSIRAIHYFRNVIRGYNVNQDSLGLYYILLFRDYTPITNQSGYQSLNANGLKTIKSDSLRHSVITLYEYWYEIIGKLEDDIPEMNSFSNYYHPFTHHIHPFLKFNQQGLLYGIEEMTLAENERKELFNYLWKIQVNRLYKISRYELVINEIEKLQQLIEQDL